MSAVASPHTKSNLVLLRELFFDYHDAVYDLLLRSGDESVENEQLWLLKQEADDALHEFKAFVEEDMQNPNVDEEDWKQ